jgi:hypothetical protein
MMKDQNIYNQVVLEIVKDKGNEYFNAADINRVASLVEKYYKQGYEDATKFQMSLPTIDGESVVNALYNHEAKQKR